MIRTSQRSKLALGILAAAMAVPAVSQAALVEDSKASLELRNMYLNRDFRSNTAVVNPSYGETWGQGFIAKFESGFTEGAVGVGVDAIGMLGVKLDSGKSRTAGNMLPVGADGVPDDEYSELGLTAKARLSKSVLRVGTLQPVLPVVQYNNTRLLPGSYTGGMLTSQEIDGLTLNVGRLTEYNLRDSSNNEEFASNIDNFDFAGGSYVFNPQLTASYYYGDYDNAYKQHFGGLVHKLPLGEGMSLTSDLRYFGSKDQGDQALGIIDNDMYQGMFTLGVGAHKFGAGYQKLKGDGAFPIVQGSDPYSINLVTYWIFTLQETDAWQVRYDYDFASVGIPGLALMARYVNADDIETAASNNGKQWERDTDLVYTLQDGTLKGLRFHLRNTTFRASDVAGATGRDVDENRVIVSYTLPLL
ncbi:OprD family porin [Pseudomonas sp. OF001]|uniref:OprD family porin n=1 Tax=Pseudomonas sp. OF001 TaxID=2772300 RepID=UPI00191ACE12|nr:OprD family porin [Pseudomonas sp. OF001]CAD5376679.1 OprD family porin [Pseudomonas sp. OF001]